MMGKSKELSQDLRNLIVTKHTDGIGYRKISKLLDVPVSTIGAIIRKWKAHHFTINRPRSGAPRKISDRGVTRMIRRVVQEPRSTCGELQKDLELADGEMMTRDPTNMSACPSDPGLTTDICTVKLEEDTSWGEGLQPAALVEVKKLFCCPMCGKGFTQRHNLVKHQRIHSGERLYKCKQCEKSFIRMQHLTKHLRLHTGERPYVCQVCSRAFSLKVEPQDPHTNKK